MTAPVVFALILLIDAALSPIADQLPMLVALALSVTIVSGLLVWPVMPWITKTFEQFFYPN